MTQPDLPRPVTRDQDLLVAICTRLDRVARTLADILDRLPQPVEDAAAPADGAHRVQLREPVAGQQPDAADLPAPEGGDGEPAKVPASPRALKTAARKTTAKNATPRKTTAKKTTGRKPATSKEN